MDLPTPYSIVLPPVFHPVSHLISYLSSLAKIPGRESDRTLSSR